MHYTFKPKGVCSTLIDFDLEDGNIKNLKFKRGCDGNLKAIAILVEGMSAEEVIRLLKGNTCGFRSTSCADQLAIALSQALEGSAGN